MREFHFDDETFEMLTEYAHLTNNKEYNEKRAKIIGIPAPSVQVAPGANVRIPLEGLRPKSVKVAYPTSSTLNVRLEGNILEIDFTEDYQARMLEIEL